MRFSLQVGMCDPSHYFPMAKAAEEAGFDGLAIPDSICYPQEASSKYPYNADGSREFLESVPFVESLIAVAAMAAVTEHIRFSTFVYKLAVRQAAVVAKQVQGIQALSGIRTLKRRVLKLCEYTPAFQYSRIRKRESKGEYRNCVSTHLLFGTRGSERE